MDWESKITMKPKFLKVLEQAVDCGASQGVHRFFKHRDPDALLTSQDKDHLIEDVACHVMTEIHEWFHVPVCIGECPHDEH
jgi:hypothetical protein